MEGSTTRASPCRCRRLNLVALVVLAVGPPGRPAGAQAIADNSFLIEEAYNQESGVVQHINVWQRALRTAGWAFSFTQEWPLGGQRHQLSYTLPIQRTARPSETGFGDAALNYRLQLQNGANAVAIAPRLSVLVPTGSQARGLGSGEFGGQVNLPVSAKFGSSLVSHWNAGLTRMSATSLYSLGASVVWLARPTINFMLEVAWSDQNGGGPESLVLNPGIRWAHNFRSGLQIVPGLAFPVGIGPSNGERSVLLYLSVEHHFRSEREPN